MSGDFYHILNRGVEEREIFYSDNDYLRFAHNLSDFNDINISLPYRIRRPNNPAKQIGHRMSDKKRIVDLLCWCFMPNHVHVLVREEDDTGASAFSKKIFGGYTKYINELKKRKGVLFQGRSKIILIEKDEHFSYLPFYIMANPVSLIEPKWRERGLKDPGKAFGFLNDYRWSGFPDLTGAKKRNFPEAIDKNLFYELFGTDERKFKDDFLEWLKGYKLDSGFDSFID